MRQFRVLPFLFAPREWNKRGRYDPSFFIRFPRPRNGRSVKRGLYTAFSSLDFLRWFLSPIPKSICSPSYAFLFWRFICHAASFQTSCAVSLSLSLSLSLSVWLSRGGGGKEERLPEGGCGTFRLGRTFEDDTNAFRFILTWIDGN